MNTADLENRFTYHPPTSDQALSYEVIRARALELAVRLNGMVPDGREKSLAITHLEQAVMWANAGIARAPARHWEDTVTTPAEYGAAVTGD